MAVVIDQSTIYTVRQKSNEAQCVGGVFMNFLSQNNHATLLDQGGS